jgi:hypothetical protein
MFDSIFAKLMSTVRAVGAVTNRVPLWAFPAALVVVFLV